jgi:drug/metabolite transporter (DMT)-like permease
MKHTWLVFVAGAALSWGAYVTTVAHGRKALGGPNASMRAFLFIGLAYFVLGVIVPLAWIYTHKVPNDPGYNTKGSLLSLLGGALGAVGALCIVFAVTYARRAKVNPEIAVAPLVFCFAPIINCFVAMLWEPPAHAPKWPFYIGLVLAAVGAALVLAFKPEESSAPAPPKAAFEVKQPTVATPVAPLPESQRPS